MSDHSMPAGVATPAGEYPFEFRGSGGEYFRIWIVNLALTILTLGIYGAWAKVRTRRYFNGSTYVAGHAFDYHASPLRILLGRAIAVVLLIGYSLSSVFPIALLVWLLVFVGGLPWLINSSLRFNARYTSYRNVRFGFTGSYFGALKAFVLWPIFGTILPFFWPLAHRARNYFYVDHHTYGGRSFSCSYEGWEIYKIYLIGWALFIAIAVASVYVGLNIVDLEQLRSDFETAEQNPEELPTGLFGLFVALYVFALLTFLVVGTYIRTMAFNLAIDNTQIDGKHWLDAKLNPFTMVWITLSNLVLIFVTFGIFYPWARVRVARYTSSNLTLYASGGLDNYMTEIAQEQSAIGEEVAGFFDVDIGL